MPRIVRTQYEYEGQIREQITVVEDDPLPVWGSGVKLDLVGKERARIDGVDRLTGRATYTVDVHVPGLLHGKILRSPWAHAAIEAIDTSEAKEMAGVHLVWTAADLPPDAPPGILASEKVIFPGEEVALVVAETEEIAWEALRRIRVRYRPLPPILTVEEALAEDAPPVVPGGNLEKGQPVVRKAGDPEEGFRQAEVVVEGTYETPFELHNAMEPHGVVAHFEGQRLTVWESTQSVSGLRQGLARTYGLPLENIRVICQYMGGGFGAKFGPYRYTHLAVLASRALGHPVRIVLDRKEENLATGNRPKTIQHLRLGATSPGDLVALTVKAYELQGAGGHGGNVTGPAWEQYDIPHVLTEEYGVFFHGGPSCSFRAPGFPEGSFALESAMDDLAHRLKMDPIELRIRHFSKKRRDGTPWARNSLAELCRVGAEKFGWSKRGPAADPRELAQRWQRGETGKLRGMGMATGIWVSAGWPPAYAWVRVQHDGSISVTSATQDIGTGTKTALAMVAAEELGVPLEWIQMRIGDTEMAPFGTGSGGSGTLSSMAPAVRLAAHEARQQLLSLAADFFSVPADAIALKDGILQAPRKDPLSVRDFLRQIGPVDIVGRGSRAPNPTDVAALSVAAHFAEVEVDLSTGFIRVVRYLAVHDSGRVINPLTMRSQIHGGILFGLGMALMENRRHDPTTGRVLTTNLEHYLLPTVADVPDIEVVLMDWPHDRLNSSGALGIGEPPVIPAAPAIANAVFHATGVRLMKAPFRPGDILAGWQHVLEEVKV
ncbi:MAG: xanthine dehydrogenase family protein molybdopterin-binding subunit [Clostridiales bacterium]|nr:xanthine dehydrogenase family protein molybdopterin-binding subunit [Clostridiales bacterium]